MWQKNFLGRCSNSSIGFEPRIHVEVTSNVFVGPMDSFVPNAELERHGVPNGGSFTARLAVRSYPLLPAPYFIGAKCPSDCGIEPFGG